MRVGKRKIIAAGAGAVVIVLAAAAATAEDLRWLLLLAIVVLLVGFAAVAQLVIASRRHLDRRLARIEKTVQATVGRGLRDPAFLEQLRSLALPQEHLEQMLRTIEAGHARIEMLQTQQRRATGGPGDSSRDAAPGEQR